MLLKELVRSYRLSRKWQQKDLATRVGVSQNYISKIELGHAVPRSETFRDRLQEALKVPRNRLLEAYAESKLSPDEARAFRQRATQQFEAVRNGDLFSSEEEEILELFRHLSPKQRRQILDFVAYKIRTAGSRKPTP